MTALVFDAAGEHKFETGVDRGVLYILDTETGLYSSGFAWNGLTEVKEKPGGAAPTKQYADNQIYLTLLSAETFDVEIDAFTYPDEFGACDGTVSPEAGVSVGQQTRAVFGLSYRTKVGNDSNPDAGYKYHMVYGLQASPSERDYPTVNDNPAPVAFSWSATSTPVAVSGLLPTSLITIDGTTVDSDALSSLTDALYGVTSGDDAFLPLPDTLLAYFAGSVTAVDLAPATFDGAHTITIPDGSPSTKYYLDGVLHTAGTVVLTSGQHKVVTAVAQPGYVFNKPFVAEWLFSYVS